MTSWSFQTVWRMGEAWKRETYVRSQSFSSESAVKYLHVGRRNIQISPPLKWPTPGTTKTINRYINLRFCIDHRIAMAKKWRVKESEWILAGRMTMTFLDLLTLFYLSQWLSEDGTLYHAKTTFPKQLGHKCIVIYDQQQHHIHRLIVHITDYTEHWILFIWSRY